MPGHPGTSRQEAPTSIGGLTIVEALPRGGMATVYKATYPGRAGYVAVKVADDEQFDAIQAEVRILRSLDHPDIVGILPIPSSGPEQVYVAREVVEGNPRCYFVMEFVDGSSLRELIRARRRLSPRLILRVIEQIGRALDYSHSYQVIHLDLKPSNILLTRDGRRAVLTDFGIARPVAGSASRTNLGTAPYMPPEQVLGHDVDWRADLYSLGVVLYEMYTGQPPYEGDPRTVVRRVLNAAPFPRPRGLRPDMPPLVEPVILRALDRDRARRYQSGAELAQALRAATPRFDAGQVVRPLAASAAVVLLTSAGYVAILGSEYPTPSPTGGTPPAVTPVASPSPSPRGTPTLGALATMVVLDLTSTPLSGASGGDQGANETPAATALVPLPEPSATAASAHGPTRTPTPRPPARPALVLAGAMREPGAVRLTWSYAGQLAPDEYFDVRVWKTGAAPAGIANVKEAYYRIGGDFPAGEYNWTIAVVRRQGGTVVGEVVAASAVGRFSWASR